MLTVYRFIAHEHIVRCRDSLSGGFRAGQVDLIGTLAKYGVFGQDDVVVRDLL